MNELYTQTHTPIQWLEQCLATIREGAGYVYLLHFANPLGQPQTAEKRAAYGLPPRQQPHYTPTAQHYIGWCSDLAARIQAHQIGHGSHFTAAAKRQGVPFTVARVWPGTRQLERKLKAQKNGRRLCPCCTPTQLTLFELTPTQIAEVLIPF